MTFKTEVLGVMYDAIIAIANHPGFTPESQALAVDLEDDIRTAMDWEDPENDSAVHNAVAEALGIFLSELGATSDVPHTPQAHFYLLQQVTALLNERNQQIYLNDILGGQ